MALDVKFMMVPSQIEPEGLEEIMMLTGAPEITVALIVLEVPGFPVIHIALEVKTQVIMSPLSG